MNVIQKRAFLLLLVLGFSALSGAAHNSGVLAVQPEEVKPRMLQRVKNQVKSKALAVKRVIVNNGRKIVITLSVLCATGVVSLVLADISAAQAEREWQEREWRESLERARVAREREERDRIERELIDRLYREGLERSRLDTERRERLERDRQESERRDRERRERLERDRQERERKAREETERMRREREQRERERARGFDYDPSGSWWEGGSYGNGGYSNFGFGGASGFGAQSGYGQSRGFDYDPFGSRDRYGDDFFENLFRRNPYGQFGGGASGFGSRSRPEPPRPAQPSVPKDLEDGEARWGKESSTFFEEWKTFKGDYGYVKDLRLRKKKKINWTVKEKAEHRRILFKYHVDKHPQASLAFKVFIEVCNKAISTLPAIAAAD